MVEGISTEWLLALSGMVGGATVAVAKGAGWILAYIDKKVGEQAAKETEAREALQLSLEGRIKTLEGEVTRLLLRETMYLRRIYQLESTLVAHAVEVPRLEGWPP